MPDQRTPADMYAVDLTMVSMTGKEALEFAEHLLRDVEDPTWESGDPVAIRAYGIVEQVARFKRGEYVTHVDSDQTQPNQKCEVAGYQLLGFPEAGRVPVLIGYILDDPVEREYTEPVPDTSDLVAWTGTNDHQRGSGSA